MGTVLLASSCLAIFDDMLAFATVCITTMLFKIFAVNAHLARGPWRWRESVVLTINAESMNADARCATARPRSA